MDKADPCMERHGVQVLESSDDLYPGWFPEE